MPESNYRELGFRRPVHEEPLTLGLRAGRGVVQAIGFTARLVAPEDDE